MFNGSLFYCRKTLTQGTKAVRTFRNFFQRTNVLIKILKNLLKSLILSAGNNYIRLWTENCFRFCRISMPACRKSSRILLNASGIHAVAMGYAVAVIHLRLYVMDGKSIISGGRQ